jgi:membrane-bound lytic murein transglycosylase D
MVRIDRSTDLKHIARGANCTITTLKTLNPALKRWATPPGMEIDLKVPDGMGQRVLEAIEEIPPDERVSWHRHKICKGEALSQIASKYEISISELKRINGISNPNKIREGQILLIPVKDAEQVASSVSKPKYMESPNLPSKINIRKYSPPAGHTKVVYTVKDGDTLSEIAEGYHVGLSKVRKWNNLRYNSTIHPGQNIVIYLPPGMEAAEDDDQRAGYDPGKMEGKKKVFHVVRKGETLSSISRLYRTKVSDILVWNTSINKDRLFPGDRIMIWVDSE